MEQKKLSVQANMIWNSAGSFAYLFSQWILTVIVVRICGYEVNGYFSLGMSLTNVFGVIANYSIRNYQVSDVKDKYSQSDYVTSRYLTCVLGMLLCVGFVFVNGYDRTQGTVIIVYMLFRLTESFVDVFHGIDQRYWRMDIVGKSLLVRSILDLAVFTVCLYITKNLVFSIILMAAVSFAVIFFYDIPQSRGIMRFSRGEAGRIKNLLLECFPLVAYLFMSNCIISIPRYFLERMHSSEVLGIYSSIATPTVIVQVAAAYLFSPLITMFSELYHDGNLQGFRNLILKIMGIILAVSAAALAGCWLLGDWGLKLLLGKSIADYTYLLIPIMITTILNAVVWFLCALLTVIRDFKGLILSNGLALCLCFAGSFFFIPKAGMDGVNDTLYLALAAEIILLCLFGIRKIKKADEEKF